MAAILAGRCVEPSSADRERRPSISHLTRRRAGSRTDPADLAKKQIPTVHLCRGTGGWRAFLEIFFSSTSARGVNLSRQNDVPLLDTYALDRHTCARLWPSAEDCSTYGPRCEDSCSRRERAGPPSHAASMGGLGSRNLLHACDKHHRDGRRVAHHLRHRIGEVVEQRLTELDRRFRCGAASQSIETFVDRSGLSHPRRADAKRPTIQWFSSRHVAGDTWRAPCFALSLPSSSATSPSR